MFSQRRSRTFLPDTANRGAEFVKKLQLFYPQADTLCGKDFDWLFDCPQTKQFLEWFCKAVGEENVLSPAEVQAYDALVASGKTILEGDALEQALQKCRQVPRVFPEAEGPSLEALEQEVQELKNYRARQLWQYNKLQAWVASLQQELRYLEEEEKATNQALRKARKDLQAEIFQTSAVLNQISERAKQLVEQRQEAGKGQPPALLYEMDLGPYMELEQQFMDAFEKFNLQDLPGSAQAPESSLQERLEAAIQMDSAWEILGGRRTRCPECAESQQGAAPESQEVKIQGSRTELRAEGRSGSEELSVGDVEGNGGSQEATERMDTKQTTVLKGLGTDGDELVGKQGSYWTELSQMETAYICAQREVIALSARVEGNCAALKWGQKTLQALKENKHEAEAKLWSRTAMLKEQLRVLRCDVAQTHAYQLLPRVKEAASLSLLPILQGQLRVETARLQDIGRRQEEAAACLASQHSRLDLLELQLKREREELDQKAAWLRAMETTLKEAQAKLQEYHDCFKEASSSMKGCSHTEMEPMRLWDVLVGQDRDKQQSCSYETMAARSSQLLQEQRELEAQLAAPTPQLPALESATEKLYRLLYNNSNQLQLCSPEMAEVMHQLITMQDALHENLMELLSDLKAKRSSLQDPILQAERNLYTYYFCDEDRLREMVEELEKQALASSKGPLMEPPCAKE